MALLLSFNLFLGGGNFGQVVRGIYKTPQGQEVEVAVKTLKESQIACTGEVTIVLLETLIYKFILA